MVSKKAIVNALFLASFTFFGLGQYVTNNFSTPLGHTICIIPSLLLILFYSLDCLYGRKFPIRITWQTSLVGFFMLSLVYSGILGLRLGVPGYNTVKTITEIVRVALPFVGFLIWNFYHVDAEDFDPFEQLRWGLGIYIIVNLIGVITGITTLAHNFEDRVSFPFSDGIYDGGNVLAIYAILLFAHIRQTLSLENQKHWINATLLLATCVLIIHINSRLTILVLLMVLGLFVIRLAYSYVLIFLSSWFFIPLLLNSKMLVYNLLTQPFFARLLQRGDLEDITSYNSRAYIWERAMDWLYYDQTGFWLGNGTRGFGTLRVYEDITDKWMVDVYTLHSHSTMFDIWLCQGIVGLALVGSIFWLSLRYFARNRVRDRKLHAFYPVLIFLLLLMQVDSFVNPAGMGFLLLLCIFSIVGVRKRTREEFEGEVKEKKKTESRGQLVVGY